MGGGLLLVGKATVCSLADEQTTAAERRMNEETVVFRRSVLLRVESCVFLKSLDRFLLVKLIGLSNKSAAVLNRLTEGMTMDVCS